jgi:hypothetical protein
VLKNKKEKFWKRYENLPSSNFNQQYSLQFPKTGSFTSFVLQPLAMSPPSGTQEKKL